MVQIKMENRKKRGAAIKGKIRLTAVKMIKYSDRTENFRQNKENFALNRNIENEK